MSEQPVNLSSLVRQGSPTPAEVKDEAFRLWVELGRSWTAVSRVTGIEVRTLHLWGERDGWEDRRVQLASSFMPGKKTETAIALRLAGHSSAIALQRMAYESAELGTPLDYRQVDAHTKIIAAAGYSSVGSRDPLNGIDQHQNTTEHPDFDNMTPDQLRDYEYLAKKRKRFTPAAPVVNGSRPAPGNQ